MTSDGKINLEQYKLIVETIFDANTPILMGAQVTHLLVSTMGIKGASVFIVNPRSEILELLATEGLSLAYTRKGPILVDQSLKLPSNLKPVIISDTEGSDRLQYPEKAEREGIRSIVSLPVNLRGKIIGALRLYHSEPWSVSELELSFLRLLTLNIGMALRYFRLAAVVKSTKDTLDEIHPIWL